MTPRISPKHRFEWLRHMPPSEVSAEWINNILETKPPTLEVYTGAEYLALCRLHDAGNIIIRGFANGNIGENSKRIFTLSYPDPEQRVQTRLFDL